jgi:hypothetical protein
VLSDASERRAFEKECLGEDYGNKKDSDTHYLTNTDVEQNLFERIWAPGFVPTQEDLDEEKLADSYMSEGGDSEEDGDGGGEEERGPGYWAQLERLVGAQLERERLEEEAMSQGREKGEEEERRPAPRPAGFLDGTALAFRPRPTAVKRKNDAVDSGAEKKMRAA